MPIWIQLLQHTAYRYRGPVLVDDINIVQVIQIQIIVSYSDCTFGYIQFFLVSTSKVYAGIKRKSK